jgi:hypothetical protein
MLCFTTGWQDTVHNSTITALFSVCFGLLLLPQAIPASLHLAPTAQCSTACWQQQQCL